MKIELIRLETDSDTEFHVALDGVFVRDTCVKVKDCETETEAYRMALLAFSRVKKQHSLRGTVSKTVMVSEEI